MKRFLRIAARALGWLVGLLVVVAAGLTAAGWAAFGKQASGERLARMRASPEQRDGAFVDPQPIVNDNGKIARDLFASHPLTRPEPPLSPPPVDPARFATAPPSGLRVTWLGHSTSLLEIDGVRVLVDPMWSERVSPYSSVGPRRFYPPLLSLAGLPPLDAVLVSHDHSGA